MSVWKAPLGQKCVWGCVWMIQDHFIAAATRDTPWTLIWYHAPVRSSLRNQIIFNLSRRLNFILDVIDLDECATGVAKCDQICINTVGSHFCHCEQGYVLNMDGYHCDGIFDTLIKINYLILFPYSFCYVRDWWVFLWHPQLYARV